jgi:hypothetical protein
MYVRICLILLASALTGLGAAPVPPDPVRSREYSRGHDSGRAHDAGKSRYSEKRSDKGGSWGRRSASPIDDFRGLLALTPAEREQALAEKSEWHRKLLQSKLQEYDALIPEERELRLRTTQLRWQMKWLMTTPPAQRSEKLAQISDEDRRWIDSRLELWDKLSPELQREVLEHEFTISYFMRLETAPPAERENLLQHFSPDRRKKLEDDIARWRGLPDQQRRRMYDNFNQFFELSEREKERTLNTLSEAERRQMEQVLGQFEKLPAHQRRVCIDSFRKFSNMTAEERDQFLQNAERWQAMTPSERETWRNLVTQLPPMPPGLPPLPPIPPGLNAPAPPPLPGAN